MTKYTYTPDRFARVACPATGASRLELTAWASDLGLKAGQWPVGIAIRGHDDSICHLNQNRHNFDDRELVSVEYTSSAPKMLVTIYND